MRLCITTIAFLFFFSSIIIADSGYFGGAGANVMPEYNSGLSDDFSIEKHLTKPQGFEIKGDKIVCNFKNLEPTEDTMLFYQPLSAVNSNAEVFQLINDLNGDNAVAEWNAYRNLMELGDAAVLAVAELAASTGPLAPRLLAVEILGKIGTKSAMDALLSMLKDEKDLAIRGQICMQLGYAQEKRAIPIIAEWLKNIGPKSLNDVPGPKEVQPSTCYIRHVEALGMIGDESAIPILEEFRKNIPQNIGYGGFLTNFVMGGVDQALADIRDKVAFWKAVEEHPGLAERIAPLFEYFQTNDVARFRHYESEVLRGTKQGRGILQELTKHDNSTLATAAKELLNKYDSELQITNYELRKLEDEK